MISQKYYYVDTCIWLNLFKKEGDETKRVPYWKLAKDFFDQVKENNGFIMVSTITLKELSFKLGGKFNEVKQYFQESGFIRIIKTTPEDYNLARQWETEHQLLSFYDLSARCNSPEAECSTHYKRWRFAQKREERVDTAYGLTTLWHNLFWIGAWVYCPTAGYVDLISCVNYIRKK